jgi:hypothetical protein
MKYISVCLLLVGATAYAGAAGALAGVPTTSAAAAAEARPSAGGTTTPAYDTLTFTNGDTLKGAFMGVEPGQGARWRHDGIKETITVIPSTVRSIRLERTPTRKGEAATCRVFLANGDKLAGDLVSLDTNGLILKTWYAGTLTLPRSCIQSVATLFQPTEVVYEGPTSVEGWTLGGGAGRQMIFDNGMVLGAAFAGAVQVDGDARVNPDQAAWQYKQGAFEASSPGSIGRDVKLPPISNLEFELQCQGYPQFAVQFYADNLAREYGGNAYMMQFSQRTLYLRHYSRPGSSTMVGNTQTAFSPGQNKVRISIRTHRAQKTIALFMDDVLVNRWTDNREMGGEGTGIMFMQQGNVPVRISNIRVTEWDGRLDETEAATTAAKDDFLTLRNQDKITGQLLAIREGKVEFKAAFTQVSVPLERVGAVSLASGRTKAAEPGPDTTVLQFRDFGRLALKVESWKEQQVEGTSPLFGPVKLNPAAFKQLDFNLPAAPTVAPATGVRSSFSSRLQMKVQEQ